MKLIIVESPTKSKTIQKFLKSGYKIVSSYGHVRDLPKSKLGIDPEKDFEMKYVVPTKAKKVVKELKELSKKADLILLATDPDREGEAISWHIAQALDLSEDKFKRIVFHEITESAIKESLNHPREIDIDLVNAQQARRALDRIVGYKLSPFLWKKVVRGLSAGRVQSVALRFVVEREREIEKFKEDEFWTIDANFKAQEKEITAKLVEIRGEKLKKLDIKNKEEANQISEEMKKESYSIADIKKKETKKNPLPPFTTSTLQQEAYKKLGFSSKMTMRTAQQLYEKGYSTYHRTDSLNISAQAISEAKAFIIEKYGEQYWESRRYKTKSKGAQEAHEAIRPSYPSRSPENSKDLDKRQLALYSLIWKRFMASQMASTILDQTSIDIKSESFSLRASGQIIKFDGFLKVYGGKLEEKELPSLSIDEILELIEVIPSQHFTQPPARYTEASLIKILEEKGIGRPSTYAPTLSVIQERNYVQKDDNKRFYPTQIGTLVNDLLVKHFSKIVDPEFTAGMETDLDKISEGKISWTSLIAEFYEPLEKLIKEKELEINKKDITERKSDEICEKCGSEMIIKLGRFGEFFACNNYPDCKTTKPIEETPEEKEKTEPCEKCGSEMKLKRSRFGVFWGCSNYPECKNIRKIEISTGVNCPKCKKGEIVQKKSKRGRHFYGCSSYPDCDFILNQKPTGEICSKCSSLLVLDKKETKCSNKECS
ncbi:MAG: type I DNA topoisomerase [Candidatus Nealsonbacteria bacterium]|nr:type I DNA topoisomerase [Candidatus Nealsonbacteria bacterium]